MNSTVLIFIILVFLSLVIFGLRELMKELNVAYKNNLGWELCY